LPTDIYFQILEPNSKLAEVLQKSKKRTKKLKRNKVSPVLDHDEKPPVRRKLSRSITDELGSMEDDLDDDDVDDDNGDDDEDDVRVDSSDDDPVASIFGSQVGRPDVRSDRPNNSRLL
jgi:hypothetical protein